MPLVRASVAFDPPVESERAEWFLRGTAMAVVRAASRDDGDPIASLAPRIPAFTRPTEYVALSSDAAYALYDGNVQSLLPDGTKQRYPVGSYRWVTNEYVVPQSTAKKGLSLRGLRAWTARATNSLPVPLSPTMSTGPAASAACAICL